MWCKSTLCNKRSIRYQGKRRSALSLFAASRSVWHCSNTSCFERIAVHCRKNCRRQRSALLLRVLLESGHLLPFSQSRPFIRKHSYKNSGLRIQELYSARFCWCFDSPKQTFRKNRRSKFQKYFESSQWNNRFQQQRSNLDYTSYACRHLGTSSNKQEWLRLVWCQRSESRSSSQLLILRFSTRSVFESWVRSREKSG